MDDLSKYIKDIESETIPSCIHVKNAIKRYQHDLKRKDLIFRQDKVDQVVNFISQLKHFTGIHSGNPFILQPWQLFIITNIYGFYWKETGQRRFQNAYIEIARKNGKTALAGAALGLYHLLADGEDAAEILLAANSKEQANICYKLTSGFGKQFDPAGKYLKRYRSEIKFDRTNSFIKVMAADSSKMDGYNSSFGLIDEYHSAPDDTVKNVIASSQAMRENPLLIIITTAGFDKSLPCYDLRTVCTEVISGVKEDDTLFSIIFTLDENDDWNDEKNWIKANPNLNITVKRSFLRKEIIKAKNNPSEEVGIRTKNFNMWCDASKVWIPDEYILKSIKKISFDDFKGEDCFIGVDLNSTDDLAAVSYEFFKDEKKYFKVKYYIPQDSLKTVPNKDIYKEWVRQGYLITTPGNVTDYDYITKDICKVANICDVFKIYYDKWNSSKWAIECTELGLPIEPFSQTVGNFNAPTKELQRSILAGTVLIDDNPITRYCFRNVVIKEDIHENGKPMKSNASSKIDGIIAMIQSDAACIKRNESVYKGQCY